MKICYYLFLSMILLVEKKIIREKEENNCAKKLYKMFVILYLKLVAFEYALIANESF